MKYYMDVISKKGMSIKAMKEEQIFPQLDKDQISYSPSRLTSISCCFVFYANLIYIFLTLSFV